MCLTHSVACWPGGALWTHTNTHLSTSPRTYTRIRILHTHTGCVRRYSSKDFSDVRNPAALFMATVKTVEGPDYGRGPPMGGGGGGGGGGPPHAYGRGPPGGGGGGYDSRGPPSGGGAPQQLVLTAGGVLAPAPAPVGLPAGAVAAAAATAAALGAAAAGAPQQHQQQQLQGGTGAPDSGPPPGVPPGWAAGRRSFGSDQAAAGVRVSEFHSLSPFAAYVHPAAAIKLQQLWDEGNELVCCAA